MTTANVYDSRLCELGEGPLWHPERRQLFWFDIVGNRLLSREGDRALEWRFDEHVSAGGWIDRDTLLVATETALVRVDISTGSRETVCGLEAENSVTRSNDGRADPQGGFWIGTMGKAAEPNAGAIYRYYRGRLERIVDRISIPNSICFDADRRRAYYTDTPTRQIMCQTLDDEGWPTGAPDVFVDLRAERIKPDGSVIDTEGCLWNAQWGSSRVARYMPNGRFDKALNIAGQHASCPAFGGDDMATLFVTTAREGIEAPDDAQGCVYSLVPGVSGVAEYKVVL
jgi:sugar lactone lactonase YvrE